MAFGLINLQGHQKPEYHALKNVLLDAQAPAPSKPVFVLGFKQMADRHPDIIGAPLDPKEWGPWKNCSTQRSVNGLLIWGLFVDSGNQMGFISNSGLRYVWKTDHLERVNV